MCWLYVYERQENWLPRMLREIRGDGDAGVVFPHAEVMVIDGEN